MMLPKRENERVHGGTKLTTINLTHVLIHCVSQETSWEIMVTSLVKQSIEDKEGQTQSSQ